MDQLTVLSVGCWLVWWLGFRNDLKSVESIAFIFAGFSFNGLLFLHLWFKFVVIPYRKRHGLEEEDQQGSDAEEIKAERLKKKKAP